MGKSVQTSQLVDLLKIVLTVGIILRHSVPADPAAEAGLFGVFAQAMEYITRVCVPLFFALSGYLFFLGLEGTPSPRWFGDKLLRRVRTLVIPYVIANVFAFLCYWAASRWYPAMLSGFLGDNWKNPVFVFWTGPVNLSLWFVRELIVACLLSPVIYLLVRYTRWPGVAVLGLLWWFDFLPEPWFLFTLGAMLALDPRPLSRVRTPGLRINPSWRGWCFFVYLYHYIPLIPLKKLAYGLSAAGWARFLEYALIAGTILAAMSAVYLLMRRYFPKLLGVLIGGKG